MPAEMAALLVLNPLTGILGLLRWSVFDQGSVPPGAVVWSSVIALSVLCGGWLLFQRLERRIADVV
jgi:ABC-type polysaccharide/polyol phosphate export permease